MLHAEIPSSNQNGQQTDMCNPTDAIASKDLHTQRAPCHNPRTARKEVLSDKVLEDATFAGALTSDHRDLGKVKTYGDPSGGEHVLQLVDRVDHVPHPLVLGRGGTHLV